jgi:SPP1 family predicted phage head-tail adaptor
MKVAPKIGALRHRIVIQQTTQTRADDKSVLDSWSTFCTADAEILPLSGSEDYVARGITASVVYSVKMRYRPGIDSKMRIVFGSRIFQIYSVRNLDEQGRFLVMDCGELDV